FNYHTNLTEENHKKFVEFEIFLNNFLSKSKNKSLEFKIDEKWNESLKRQLYLSTQQVYFTNKNDNMVYSSLTQTMESIYGKAKICRNETNCLQIEPGINDLFRKSRDYDELLWAWENWHDVMGPNVKNKFTKTVKLKNKAAKENGYKDLSEAWIEEYEDKNFEKNYDELYEKIRPLYEQLHAYVRRKLKAFYGYKYPKTHNPKLIPAHILGNIHAQTWENIFDILIPFSNFKPINISKSLQENNYTVESMFKSSENFYTSIGLYRMTPTFWKKSMFVKPNDTQVICHGFSIDFFNGYDFRIKMCTEVNEEYFYTIYHEMGHTEYHMAYKKQPPIFNDAPNPGFHEAIGDTIYLSVQTPKYLKKINLIQNDSMSYEQEINYLMMIALQKIAFLPYGYLIDKWRWNVFRGNINESNYNDKFWEMRETFQGIEAPIKRNESNFDPGAKFHIISHYPYSAYFIATFLQFQFYESLCKLSNHSGPIFKCDFYQSKKAGEHLKDMLSLGTSKHWRYALKLLVNQTETSADSILEYFRPLYNWLIDENSKYPDNAPGF
ncbi:unnamed protein product, partial [Brachionus calyciflorus]